MEHSKKHKSIKDYRLKEVKTRLGKSSELGKGAYGIVKCFESIHTSELFAIKIIAKSVIKVKNTVENVINEGVYLKKFKNPYIVKLYNLFEDKDNVYFVFEYAEKGNLYEYLKKKKNLKENEALIYIIQLMIALNYIHSKKIIHRDIKPENILIVKGGSIKLSDFGWSIFKKDDVKRTTMCGTADYMAPEITQNKEYDESIDIWSAGVLLYELTQGYPPFSGSNIQEKFNNSCNFKVQAMKKKLSTDCVNLINNMMNPDPTKRIKPHEIVNIPFIKDICKNILKIDLSKYIRWKSQNSNSFNNTLNISNNNLLSVDKNKSNLNITNTSMMKAEDDDENEISYINKNVIENNFNISHNSNISNNIKNNTINSNNSKISNKNKKKYSNNDVSEEIIEEEDDYQKRNPKKKNTNMEIEEFNEFLEEAGIENENLDIINELESNLSKKKSKKLNKINKSNYDNKTNRSKSKSKVKKPTIFSKNKKFTVDPNNDKSNYIVQSNNHLKVNSSTKDIYSVNIIENDTNTKHQKPEKKKSKTIRNKKKNSFDLKNEVINKYDNDIIDVDNDEDTIIDDIKNSRYFRKQNSRNFDLNKAINRDKDKILKTENIVNTDYNNNYNKKKQVSKKNIISSNKKIKTEKQFVPTSKLEKINDKKFIINKSIGEKWVQEKDYQTDNCMNFVPKKYAYVQNPYENQLNDLKNNNDKIKDYLDILEMDESKYSYSKSNKDNPKKRLKNNVRKEQKNKISEDSFFSKNNLNNYWNLFLKNVGCANNRNNNINNRNN